MRNNPSFQHKLLLCLIPLFVFAAFARGAEEQWIKSLSGIVQSPSTTAVQIQTAKVIDIKDQWYDYMLLNPSGSGSGAWDNIFRVSDAQALVQLRYDDTKRRYTSNHWDMDVTYSLVAFDATGATTTYTAQVVHIDYNPASGYTVNDKQVKIYSNVHRAYLTITAYAYHEYNSSNTLISSSTTGPPPSDLADVWLDVTMKVNRDYFLSTSQPYINQLSLQNNELKIYWPYVQGAESYDVEFLFVDIPSGTFASTTALVDFSKATRVNTPNQYFVISLAYPRGKIIYRVRGVEVDPTHPNTREEGLWSYPDPTSPLYCSAVTANNTGTHHYYSYDFDGLEGTLNWQYSATYVEDGKKAEAIGFYDGGLRARQNVTVSNTENNAVIAQTDYDYQGRPAIQFMPTVQASEGLQYYQYYDATANQYKPINNSSGGAGYTVANFDLDSKVTGGPDSVSRASGAGQYYSSNNPNRANGNAYTPEADGYPFAQTRYMNDGTNRIRTQTGPGPDHNLNSGHATQYFYGTPTGQEELDRLFGNEVGYVSHYKKNLVVDPNGQVSVVYLDQEGRVVATALAGDTPDNLEDLEYRESPQTLTADLLGNNHLAQNQAMVSQSTITVSSPGNYTFDYALTQGCYQEDCMKPLDADGCIDCKYDLAILVTDVDGDSIDLGQISGLYSYRQYNISLLASTSFTVNFSSVGVYTVTKTLSLHSGIQQTLAADYITNQRNMEAAYEADPGNNPVPCVVKPGGEPAPCTYDCHSICEQQYHHVEGETEWWIQDDGSITFDPLVGAALIANCENNICNHDSPKQDPCDLKYQQMLKDMSPHGQYFDNTVALYTVDPLDPNNVQFPNPTYNSYTDIGGYHSGDINGWLDANMTIGDFNTAAGTAYTTWDDVRDNWDPSYASFLVAFHPEKCAYDYFCGGVSCIGSTGHTHDQLFDYDWAMQQLQSSDMTSGAASGYFNPLGITLNGYVTSGDASADHSTYGPDVTGWSHIDDPYFDCSHVVCTESGNDNYNLEAETVITNMLTHYVPVYDNTGTFTGNYYSLWYLIEDPDGIADGVCTNCSSLSPDIINLFNGVQNLFANGMSKSQYFYGVYQYLKQFTVSMGYDEYVAGNTPPCVSSSSTPMHYHNGYLETTAGGGPSTIEGYTVLFPENPLYTSISNGCAAPDLTSTNDLISAIQDLSDAQTPSIDPDAAFDQASCSCDNLHSMLEGLGIDPATFDANVATSDEQTDITSLFNDVTQPSTLYSWTDIKPWFVECHNSTPLMTNLTDLPSPYLCGEDPVNPSPEDYVAQAQSDCEDESNAIAANQVSTQYEQGLFKAAQDFVKAYSNHCMTSLTNRETFTVTYTLNEYYYTLYYYDQAGDLIKTVPPKGVDILDYPSIIGEVADVENHRVDPATYPTAVYPSHLFVTNYKYNSLQQVVENTTPDGGTTKMWYDEHGRVIATQDARQAALSTPEYSYILYDALGRPYESGQLENSTALTYAISRNQDATTFSAWIAARTGPKTEVVHSYYDETIDGLTSTYVAGGQANLRNRISSSTYEEFDDNNDLTFDNASHYSYDIHGNAVTVVQENNNFQLADIGQSKKRIDYQYDVATGKVNQVDYQSDPQRDGTHAFDEFHYRYEYDANNRLTVAFSSRDNVIWEKEAKYFYYPHGPLQRTEIGDKEVQGQDFAYTLLGWIKGVNSDTKTPDHDMGKDGSSTGTNLDAGFGYDAYGYSLRYFANDYKYIGGFTASNGAIATLGSSPYTSDVRNLYNGNISGMVTALTDQTEANVTIQGRSFVYDQLNRIRYASAFTDASFVTSNSWGSGAADNRNYAEEFHYDLNGNILSLIRNGNLTGTHQQMDNFTYHYSTTAHNNRLMYVEDNATCTSGDYGTDIDAGQLSPNYLYDASGNLVIDDQEEIGDATTNTSGISWSSRGKIKNITRYSGSKPDLEYIYDAMGNRIVKIVKTGNQDAWVYTYYTRDPQGNVLAVYKRTFTDNGSGNYTDNFDVEEHDIYGGSRTGIRKGTDIAVQQTSFTSSITLGIFVHPTFGTAPSTATWSNGQLLKRTLGYKEYELTNHLGNVLETVSDKRLISDVYTYSASTTNYSYNAVNGHYYYTPGLGSFSRSSGSDGKVDYYSADVLSYTDYYAFGAPMPGRNGSSSRYRYGFNDKEDDPETVGTGEGTQDYGMRIYNPSLGRFLSVDPLTPQYACLTPYQFASNTPIQAIDLDGEEADKVNYTWTPAPATAVATAQVVSSNSASSVCTLEFHIVRVPNGTNNPAYSYQYSGQNGANPDNRYPQSIYNAIVKTNFDFYLPKRLIDHYELGNGWTYHMNEQEMMDVHAQHVGIQGNTSEENANFNKYFDPLAVGGSVYISDLTVASVANTAGTLGNFYIHYSGTLTKTQGDDGSIGWTFSGQMRYEDYYNFDIKLTADVFSVSDSNNGSEADGSDIGRNSKCLVGQGLTGQGYSIVTPSVDVQQTSGSAIQLPAGFVETPIGGND